MPRNILASTMRQNCIWTCDCGVNYEGETKKVEMLQRLHVKKNHPGKKLIKTEMISEPLNKSDPYIYNKERKEVIAACDKDLQCIYH